MLGVAVQPDAAGAPVVFLYRTTPRGNEVVRGRLVPEGLSDLETVLDGIPASGNHNGGRIAFGPDGLLYVATGDAGLPSRAQDPDDLGGKILRITVDGDPAPDNPDPGSPVWSLGHRNVQGLGWAPDGTMFASEFGQNTWDELNVIEPGGNYGWPVVEGGGGERAPAARAARAARWPTTSTSSPGRDVGDVGSLTQRAHGHRRGRVPRRSARRAAVAGRARRPG
ncbi:PQQ-dependent sugar dehydrogenase [Cellulomonas sp. ATA003]|uniref:PQQ-dependent sugar dehydrogenase n=1 Tax=Cellulomonas sp. ATA003 TaxID=3073064 RepID=UPI002872DD2F|nr:PQQ-dependent sugar dehydrogenase [Cellulomonas sp. ATA003]WNB87572.1 PQQ-dependent sugar dehydrogenase [Cellulomonas sp. ATA003]